MRELLQPVVVAAYLAVQHLTAPIRAAAAQQSGPEALTRATPLTQETHLRMKRGFPRLSRPPRTFIVVE
ncbi:hypothetical protein [Actinoplanes sp. TFC3]|uniref:hypothetical protein n=1 Tax=Actinoplanes sp. TFC3 TaxID=1710355 RepID=UPI00082DA09F|nr:hypothetical protein [Actinoplanes sp. TFC3]